MKKQTHIIRSSKVSNKFGRLGKLNDLNLFIDEYRNVLEFFIDELWEIEDLKKFINKDITKKCKTWLSARAIQAASKQACGIIRGTKKKQKKRKFQINKFLNEKQFKKAKKLQKIYDETSMSKPNIKSIEPELDSRFVKINLDNKTSFDGWITFSSLGDNLKIKLPFKRTKHFNKLTQWGDMTNGCRISKKSFTFCFKKPIIEEKETGSIMGVDIGVINSISCSNGYKSETNKHGYDLNIILEKLSRKKKGSKAFSKAQKHRDNYINWSINQLDLKDIKGIKIEDIKYLRKGKRTNRKLSHWNYKAIFQKLEDFCELQGVLVEKINPTYTSQRCGVCGWTKKSNRKGKLFKCSECGHTHDADLNASFNISLPLDSITKEQRLKQINRRGFYWLVSSQEYIVPDVPKV